MVFGYQGGHHGANVLGQAGAAQRRHVADAPIHDGVVAHDACAEVGLDGPWRHDSDPHAPFAQLPDLMAAEDLDAPFIAA